jgi:transposase InsO family protein
MFRGCVRLRRLLESALRLLKNNGMKGSMGRVASSGDNSAMESLFSLLHKNVIDIRRWTSCEELRLSIAVWFETKYIRRRQRALGKITPVEFEMISQQVRNEDH